MGFRDLFFLRAFFNFWVGFFSLSRWSCFVSFLVGKMLKLPFFFPEGFLSPRAGGCNKVLEKTRTCVVGSYIFHKPSWSFFFLLGITT